MSSPSSVCPYFHLSTADVFRILNTIYASNRKILRLQKELQTQETEQKKTLRSLCEKVASLSFPDLDKKQKEIGRQLTLLKRHIEPYQNALPLDGSFFFKELSKRIQALKEVTFSKDPSLLGTLFKIQETLISIEHLAASLQSKNGPARS